MNKIISDNDACCEENKTGCYLWRVRTLFALDWVVAASWAGVAMFELKSTWI